jgi:anti-sigma regulatory factor (Ser/Thr protein kinase)
MGLAERVDALYERRAARAQPRIATMADDDALLRLDLLGREQAPGAARKALTALNGSLGILSERKLSDARLLASELVANALHHGDADGKITLSVHGMPKAIRVAVSDEGDGFDPDELRAPSSDRTRGWGLAMVRVLADRWGVERNGATTVWFEIDHPRREAPLGAHASPAQ